MADYGRFFIYSQAMNAVVLAALGSTAKEEKGWGIGNEYCVLPIFLCTKKYLTLQSK